MLLNVSPRRILQGETLHATAWTDAGLLDQARHSGLLILSDDVCE